MSMHCTKQIITTACTYVHMYVVNDREQLTYPSGWSLMRNLLRLKLSFRILAHENVLIRTKFWKTTIPMWITDRWRATLSWSYMTNDNLISNKLRINTFHTLCRINHKHKSYRLCDKVTKYQLNRLNWSKILLNNFQQQWWDLAILSREWPKLNLVEI